MKEKVLHEGVVHAVFDDKITVVIINASACSACHAKGACLASDLKEKEIEIRNFKGQFHNGQQVNIVGEISQGYKAAFFGYFLPFLVVFFTLILVFSITDNEGTSGILSLVILIPYYAMLYFFREKIKKSFDFQISAN